MIWYDWLILVLPVCFVMYMGFHSRRYVRGVSDFLSAGRLCGRYVISMGDVANSLSIIGLVAYIEVHYKTGFSVGFWSNVLMPLSIVLGLTGFVIYRFRETRAMSVGQFFEMRYSRRFRIVAAGLRSLAEMVANMIMPAIAARFFIQMLDLPATYHVLGLELSTYVSLMVLFLTLAISLICFGGTLALVITDTIQGMILYPVLACFVVFLFWKFSVTEQIMPVMADRVAGESFINPYDIGHLRDFNLFTVVIVAAYGTVVNRGTFIGGGYSTAAKSAQEQKMAGLLGTWRSTIITVFYILIASALIAFLNHRDFAVEAGAVRKSLVARVADDVFKNDSRSREAVKAAVAAVPPQMHKIGVDPPLSQKENLDTAFLDIVHQALLADARERVGCDAREVAEPSAALIDAEGRANDDFQQCRTLYNQLSLSVTMRTLLPHGLFGLFALLLFLAMLSTDDTRIYSAALTIAQDVVLPLKKKPFTPRGHLWMIRIVSICIGVFFLAGSYYVKQLDYYQMFNTLACAMWSCGSGAIMMFGLYSRFGTTAGAWTALGTSAALSGAYLYVQRSWADVVYPAIAKASLVDSFDRALRWLSSPFEPYIHWEMDAVRCPVNAIEFNFFLSLLCILLYVVVSKFTCKVPFNLDRMLHRGRYVLPENDGAAARQTKGDGGADTLPSAEGGSSFRRRRPFIRFVASAMQRIVGITPEYTRGDKAIAWGVFAYSFGYGFGLCFLGVVAWNAIRPWPVEWWSRYFVAIYFVVPCIVACVTTVWFGVGGVIGLRQLFRDLRARKETNVLDDGRVEGHISLADKQRLEAVDRENKEQTK
ncbi:MAG: sodium:panthothenate symporter [Kiritimatiellae bacterium]|nr:sodium:panthothenate symporter [Kiritimatiellia bacterium]